MGHAHGFQHFGYSLFHVRTVFPAGGSENEAQVLLHASVHKQLEILEYDAEPPPQERYVLLPDAPEIESAHFPLSLCQRIFGYHCPDDGRLSGPHLAYYIKEIPGIYLHVQSVQDRVLASEDIGVPEGYHRFSFFHRCQLFWVHFTNIGKKAYFCAKIK